MVETAMKLGKKVQGTELLTSLEIGVPVYLDIHGDQYCSYLEVLRTSEDKYELTALWETDEGAYTKEEVNGKNEYWKYQVTYNKEIRERIVASEAFENVTESNQPIDIDDLYNYTMEDLHLYNDKDRNKISLETFTMVKITG